MRRHPYCIALMSLVLLLTASGAAAAQGKPPRMCFLTFDPGSPEAPPARYAAFFKALAGLGYVHGRTITIDYLAPSAGSEQFPALVEDCLRRGPDLIAAATTPAALAAKAATRSVPIVMTSLGDPVRTGLVASLAAPGGNVTGMSIMTTELAAKRLSLLKEVVPRLSRVLVLTYPVDPISQLQVDNLKEAAPVLGVTLLFQDIKSGDDIEAAFESAVKERADGLTTVSAAIFWLERRRITELAARHRLPAIYPHPVHVTEAGGLIAYHAVEADVLREAAGYVDRVLKGEKPAELPVQQPTKFNLVINLKTAKALGLDVPASILVQADEVIE